MNGMNSINGAQGIQPPMHLNPRQSQNEQIQESPNMPPAVAQISGMGQLFSAVESSGQADQSELKQFHDSIFSALHSGYFDAGSLTESASDTLKSIAEEAGINIEEALTEFSEQVSQMKGGRPQGPPPPPPPSESSNSSDEEDDDNYWDTEFTI